jgi:N-acetylglutamate synthase-like GNAT family acetyltransferase
LVVAKASGILVGAAELKIREMDIYPQYKFWVGGVYVVPNQRGKGIASKLVVDIISRARNAGIDKLYLQTQDLSGGVYARHGFKPIEEVDSKGVQV